MWAQVVNSEFAGGNGRSVDTDDTHDGDDTGAGAVNEVFLCRD